MTKLDKLRKRIEQEPKTVRFEDLDRLLLASGFQVRQPGRGGSHYFYSKGRVTVTVPRRRQQMPPVYVRLVLEAIGQAEEEVKSE
jgi:predicted RNA binding protein YcfA (HicA-like mRNA interferase family)